MSLRVGENLPERHAQHLAPLVEHGLHYAAEERPVAPQVVHAVARHADYRALHLGRRVEHALVDRKQILHVVPRLYEHAQYAVSLRARSRSHALCHLALYHARAAGYELLVVEHLEEYLRRYVIRVIARKHELAPAEKPLQVHPQKVLAYDGVPQLRVLRVKVSHRLGINLDHLQLPALGHEVLRKHAHAGAHFKHGQARAGVHRVGYRLGNVQVGQEVLPEVLLWSYLFHVCQNVFYSVSLRCPPPLRREDGLTCARRRQRTSGRRVQR